MKRNLWPDCIDDDKPISVVLGVESAERLAPSKLSLAVKVGRDDALVVGATLGIVWRVRLIERMGVSDENCLNAAVAVGHSLDLEGAVIGWMDAENVLRPAGNR